MFCTECGKPRLPDHKFCPHCGQPAPVPELPVAETTGDWREVEDLASIIAHPDVKRLIDDAARQYTTGMSGEEFLEKAELALKTLGQGPVPLKLIADIAGPLYTRLGVKTGSQMHQSYDSNFARTLTALLCAMARQGITPVQTQQGKDGCAIEADLPSSLTSWAGKVTLLLESQPEGTAIRSAIVIPGQALDWGRSKRVLAKLHEDLLHFRAIHG